MASSSGLLLSDKDVSGVSDTQRFEVQLHWLKNLPSAIQSASKDELKGNRKSLIDQLLKLLHSSAPSALRLPLGESFVALFSAGSFSNLLDVVNKCNDVIKSKDDASSNKLTALQCLETIFKTHGRMAGSCFLDVTQSLIRLWKSVEYRCNVLDCFKSIIIGLGNSCASMHKDMYKLIKQGLTDKQLSVRVAAAKCGIVLCMDSSVYYTQELDSLSQHCLKAFEGSSYDVRCTVALFLGTLLSMTQKPSQSSHSKGKVKMASLDDCLSILYNGYIKGGGGFEILKGGGAMTTREVRIGVSQAYVFFFAEMGGIWLERHLSIVLSHFVDLLANPKAVTTHVDSVYSRKCVGFIIQYTFSRLLGETAQLSACSHLCNLVLKCCQAQSSTHDEGVDSTKEDKSTSTASSKTYQHSIVCSLTQISKLILLLNTASHPLIVASDSNTVGGDNPAPLIKVFNKILLHHSLAIRLSAAGTLYCVGLSLPSIITPLVDYLMKGLQVNRGNADGIVGFTNGLAALLSSSQFTELGIPSTKALEIFKYGEEMVKTQYDGGKLSLANIQSGWALIGAYLSLGPSYVRVNLRNVIQLWHSVFPHSRQELMAEMKTGSISSWRHTLETRNGALTSIVVFTSLCQQLLSAEMCKRVMLPLDSALAMTTGLIELIKTHGVQLKGQSAMLRLRLYQSFYHLPPHSYEGCLNTLLKEVVAEFTLTDNLASTTTSLLRSLCHQEESTLLGSWLEETDHQTVEEMLQPNSAAGSGALEHDPASSYLYTNKGDMPTEPLPLGVAVIDAAIKLFGRLFHQLSSKHQKQLLTHFKECIKQAKPANRQQAIQINIFTGFLAGLKGLVETKGSLSNQDDIINTAYSLIPETLSSQDPMLRCAGSEALGRLSQVVGEAGFVGQIVQMAVDAIKIGKDSKMGYILSLGCLHRYVGGMGSGQHLQLSVITLQQLAADTKSTIGQVWGLHALTLIADSGGPLFRNHVDSTLTLLFNLLLTTPIVNVQMYRCLGKCLSALITTLGPELQMPSKSMIQMRERCLICCYIVQCHPDPVVKSSSISCLQQLQLFAPSFVSLQTEVPVLCECLNSSHLLLRRSAANCLRQFCQQEPKIVWDIARQQVEGTSEDEVEKELEKMVLSKLDIETDEKLRFDLKEVLFSLVCGLSPNDPMKWLLLLNGVLSATTGNDNKPDIGGIRQEEQGTGGRREGEDEDEEMAAKFTIGEDKQVRTNITPRWQTKVFAIECSRKIYNVCKSNPGHFDLAVAQRKQSQEGGDFLVMHLAELVKTSFIAATATVDQLKLEGYKALQDVIRLFASTVDPDYPGHVLLEQYQAQIGAALRPAFSTDSAPHVTAIACQVCGEWLGSGVSRDISDLKRVQQLLVTSLDKVRHIGSSTSIYGDAVGTLESLAVLKAWAELYIKLSHEDSAHTDKLIAPHLPILDKYWILALQDHAYISLPAKFNSQLPSNGGTFYNNLIFDSVKAYYSSNWSSILHAAAISLSRRSQTKNDPLPGTIDTPAFASMIPINMGVASMSTPTDERHSTFYMLLGVAVQSLCNSETYDSLHDVQCCLNVIEELVKSKIFKDLLLNEEQLIIELLELLHRILLTSPSPVIMQLTLDIANTIASCITATPPTNTNEKVSKSLLVTAVHCLFLHVPGLSDRSSTIAIDSDVKNNLICSSICLLPMVTKLHPHPNDTLLPMIFHLTLTALPHVNQASFTTVFQAFKSLCLMVSTDSCDILHAVLNSLTSDNTQLSDQTRLLLSSVVLMSKDYTISHDDQLLKQWSAFAVGCLTNDTGNLKLQLTAVQVYDTLFQCGKPQLAFACVHEIVPEVVQFIQRWSNKTTSSSKAGQSDVVIKATGVLEGLLKLTPTSKQNEMMGLLVPLFISLLVPPTGGQSLTPSSDRMVIHRHILNALVSIGPQYPGPFKAVITSSPDLKARLEAAIKNNKDKQPTSTASVKTAKAQQPAIKLKMDFSNFK